MSRGKVVQGFRLPSDDTLTENEWAWVSFIRLASNETDPAPTLGCVQALQRLLSEGH